MNRWIKVACYALAGYATYQGLRKRRLAGCFTFNAAEKLKGDHEKTLSLFERYEAESDPAVRDHLVGDIVASSIIHETIEEDYFYPAIRRQSQKNEMMDLAHAQHQRYNEVMTEMQARRGEGKPYDELVRQLHQIAREHITMEEGAMFAAARRSGVNLYALWWPMTLREQQLKMKLGYNMSPLRQELRALMGRSPHLQFSPEPAVRAAVPPDGSLVRMN